MLLEVICATILFSGRWESLTERVAAHPLSIFPFPEVLKMTGRSWFA